MWVVLSVIGLFFYMLPLKNLSSETSLKHDIRVVKSSSVLINCSGAKLPRAFIHSESLIVINYSHLCKAPCLITVYCWNIVLVIQDFSLNPLNRMLNFMCSEFHNLPVIRLAVGRQTFTCAAHRSSKSFFAFFLRCSGSKRENVPCKVCTGHSLMPHLRPLSYEEHNLWHKMVPCPGWNAPRDLRPEA